MPTGYLYSPKCFLSRKRKRDIVLEPVTTQSFTKWLGKQGKALQAQIKDSGFCGQQGQIFLIPGKDHVTAKAAIGVSDPVGLYDLATIADKLCNLLSDKTIESVSFSLSVKSGAEQACIGWGLACQKFETYKTANKPTPSLVMPDGVDKKRIQATIEALSLIRDLINTPANALGPAELEKAVREISNIHEATVKVTGDKVLEKEFPLIFAVGDSSPRRPRLIDLKWGNARHPKITLVGKGVCFDTGGLDLKPSQYMALMKKDMGGAAHALGLAHMIMSLKLPVRLRLLIPAVENSVSGVAFRPGDVFTSRKGLKVENTNTDAEGRLILADALTYACEEKPALVMDFATLTGSARAALGAAIPAMFSNVDTIADDLKKLSFKVDDPVWPMPLWEPYKKLIESNVGDLVNSAATPGDLIYSALFLQSFLLHDTSWVHLDIFAWENSGKPGRPKGGADTGMRAALALIEKKYGKK
ncbi:MAG: leucyl aminopeptidase family protein [Rhodospirillales bacterium]|nr:leucyl aminopeptidase family protein [Rhodospirillales bacterium]MCB9995859.1 leucyl aminopeptidase family protein [Rhodospirillales bacterium]